MCPGPRRGELSRPHSPAQRGLGGGRQAPLGLRASPFAPSTPRAPVPRSHTLDRALGESQSLGKLQGTWGTNKKATEQREQRRGRSSPVGSPRVEVGTLRVRKGPGSRVAPRPRLALRAPSLPCLGSGSPSASPLSPPLGPTPLARGSGQGIKRRGRKGEGEAAEKGDDPFPGGVEFQLPTLGPNCAPQPGPSPPHLPPRDRAADRGVVWSARSGELGSARHAPALPRRPHASPCLPFISPTSVFPEGGDALLPPRQGPGGFLHTPTLQGAAAGE